jgi:hypothetical protein
MQRLYSLAAVVTGGGTAAGTATHLIPLVTGVIGATCAIITTVAALYYYNKNYKLNLIKAGLRPRPPTSEDK